jgi:two-component system response regulator PilR (NtrC family)
VVEHINQKGLDLPVAVITAYGSAENAVAALKAGAFDYLAKPVALEQLRALVKQALKVPEPKTPPPSVTRCSASPPRCSTFAT